MNLTSGTYKVKHFGKFDIMKVYQKKDTGQVVYCIGNAGEFPIDRLEHNHEIEVIKKLDTRSEVLNPKLHVSWYDEKGDRFVMSASSTTRFRAILDFLPFVLQKLKDRQRNNNT